VTCASKRAFEASEIAMRTGNSPLKKLRSRAHLVDDVERFAEGRLDVKRTQFERKLTAKEAADIYERMLKGER